MRIRTIHINSPGIAVLLAWIPAVMAINTCRAQSACADSLKIIARAYAAGDWNRSKMASIAFLNRKTPKNVALYAADPTGNAGRCKDNIPEVYAYLIQSYLKLYNIDSAYYYYSDALIKDYHIDLEPVDEAIFKKMGALKKHALNFYIGIISSDYRELKLGVAYGLTSRIFLETSVLNMYFNHGSETADGLFGKPLQVNQTHPYYSFRIAGYERFLDVAAYYKQPVIVSQKEVNIFYVSVGCFVTYFLNTHVNSVRLTKYDMISAVPPVYQSGSTRQRYGQLNELGVNMDLKQLYKERFNIGMFMNLGSTIRLKNQWDLFFEIKFAAGRNNTYRYKDFESYKAGVDYFFLVFGATRKLYKMKAKKQGER